MQGKITQKGMQFLSVLLVAGMFAAAEYFHESALIFPEIAALACGAWVMKPAPWRFTALTVWVSPTVAALTGVALLRFFPAAPLFLICAAFVAVAVQLKVMRSAVMPSISAAILPILTKADTLLYPASVCALTGLIALVHLARGGTLHPEETLSKQQLPAPAAAGSELGRWGKLTAGIFLVAIVALRSNALFMIAPPLIVTFVELSKPESPLRRRMWQVLSLLSLASLAGVLELHLLHYLLHCPLALCAALTLATVYLLYGALDLPFPPAAAIALLPTIIPRDLLWYYPWQVLGGSVAFLALSAAIFKGEEVIAPSEELVAAHEALSGEGEEESARAAE
ncbi:hypothetical protein LPW11_16895 [Geomonas sp. RF6]|uniref:hypothetical protein n=1 Tax=Geomonas sp. RF6 TaxID=2897342 RepID=UPI001E483AA7|nr:hypothetical protein [Geomonas sp. RF6]UFS69565.1 hypothetical protein LPW11_16895 [Geomonas sp. RF6]